MAIQAGVTRAGSAGTAMLEQLAEIEARGMSPDTARKLLQLEFDSTEKARVTALSKKAQEGTLLPDEQAELDEYIRVADVLAVLQSRARQALKHADLPV
jgi:hypothetical protein